MLGTDAAMFMLPGMARAFLGTSPAGGGTGLDRSAQNALIIARLPRQNRPCRDTDIGAVQIQPDTLAKIRHHILGQTGIRTGCAALRAGIAFLDTANERLRDAASTAGMGVDHLSSTHGILLSLILATDDRSRRRKVPDFRKNRWGSLASGSWMPILRPRQFNKDRAHG